MDVDAEASAEAAAREALEDLPRFFAGGVLDVEVSISVARNFGGLPRGLFWSEKETLALPGDVSVRLPGVLKIDFGGRPRGRGAAEEEA